LTGALAGGMPTDRGFELAFLIGTGGATVAALCVLLIPGRRGEQSVPREETAMAPGRV
jgi:hypothetical protein